MIQLICGANIRHDNRKNNCVSLSIWPNPLFFSCVLNHYEMCGRNSCIPMHRPTAVNLVNAQKTSHPPKTSTQVRQPLNRKSLRRCEAVVHLPLFPVRFHQLRRRMQVITNKCIIVMHFVKHCIAIVIVS